eukprot:scaffold2518_cov178-Amphora_coffeaeformis.AAC.15
MYSAPIETVNSTAVGVYTTQSKADRVAREYFFETLGYEDCGESANGGFYCRDDEGHCGTWEEEVWVTCQELEEEEESNDEDLDS